MQALGAEPEVGAAGTIEFTAHGKAYSLPMVVSGWYESFNDQLSQMAAAPSFAEAHPEMFQFTYNEDSDITDTYWSAIKVKSSNHLKEHLDKQLTHMVSLESLYYALGASLIDLVLAVVLNFTMIKSVCSSICFFTYHITLMPAVIICLILIILSIIIPPFILKVFNRGTIVEKPGVAE